jgi:hypothetical protein
MTSTITDQSAEAVRNFLMAYNVPSLKRMAKSRNLTVQKPPVKEDLVEKLSHVLFDPGSIEQIIGQLGDKEHLCLAHLTKLGGDAPLTILRRRLVYSGVDECNATFTALMNSGLLLFPYNPDISLWKKIKYDIDEPEEALWICPYLSQKYQNSPHASCIPAYKDQKTLLCALSTADSNARS